MILDLAGRLCIVVTCLVKQLMLIARQLVVVQGVAVLLAVGVIGWKPVQAEQRELDSSLPHCELSLGSIGPYVPGRWNAIAVDVVNPTENRVDLLSLMYFVENPSRQYGRRLWLPPHSRRSAVVPVLVPQVPGKSQLVNAKSYLLDRSVGGDVASADATGALIQDGQLALQRDQPVTGIMSDAEDEGVRRAVVAMRLAQKQSDHVVIFTGASQLRRPLDGFDTLVLSTDAPARAGALGAIRDWLFAGGRLWIMLDRVDPATVASLLGESFECQVVDRVDLTEVKIVEINKNTSTADGNNRQFNTPVELVRVLPGKAEVTHRVAGWPAAFWQHFGQGQVLFTTLEDRAWIDQCGPGKPATGIGKVKSSASEPLATLGSRFSKERPQRVKIPEPFRELLKEHIGYEIVGRDTAFGLLAAYCAAMAGAALWLTRRGAAEHLAWIGAITSIFVAGAFVFVGGKSRKQIPSTIAAAQFVQSLSGTDQATVTGLLGIYTREPFTGAMGARDGAEFHLDPPSGDSAICRMVWTDSDRFHIENMTLGSGLHLAQFSCTLQLPQPMAARATFSPDGLTGLTQTEPFVDLADALIATPAGNNLAVRLDADGTFTAAASDRLSATQYLAGALLTDKQRARAKVYEQLLDSDGSAHFPTGPCLLIWARATQLPIDLLPDVPLVGDALLAVPLVIKPSAPGTQLLIPAAFLPYESVSGLAGTRASTAYDNARRRWIGPLTLGSKITLRFQLPPEILPLQLTRADAAITIRAPKRKLEISGIVSGEEVQVTSVDSPAGRIRFTIDDSRLLELDDRGGLRLTFSISSRSDEQLASIAEVGWQIENLQLDVSAIALQPAQSGDQITGRLNKPWVRIASRPRDR